jgi:hypothetical protein
MNGLRMAMVSAACLAAVCAPSNTSAQSNLRNRVAAAIETVEKGCGEDIKNFCGKVTRGEGLLLCMQAHEDQLSFRCQFTLYRASRHLKNALHRVERIADACWNDIEARCGDAERIGQCVVQKRELLSRSCRSVVGAIQQAAQGLATLRGMPVHSSDNTNVGKVVEVTKGPDGKVHSIRVEVGRFLGLGERVVTVTADKFEQLADRIKLRLSGEEVRSLPETKKQ